ncbi:ATP-grasp fold amidoligase family protein [Enterovibrio norvegicus]|uniref:ATP-grasp fold amidoligase family protein n=1 Tax=Enterovibrio norvegicus TaxID=188144 RepID=UPI00389AC943
MKLKRFAFKFFSIFLSERLFFSLRYFHKQNKWPNLEHPCSFSEKLLVSKLREPTDVETISADKYAVRKVVKDKIGEKYLIPLIAVITNVKEFESVFDNLPDKFAMKASHGSGWNEIVFDKSKVDKYLLQRKVDFWLSDNYYYYGLEKQYRDIPPSIVIEELLLTDDGNVPYDYKFYCFGHSGSSEMIIQVDLDRFGDHQRAFYDVNWNKHEISILSTKSTKSTIEVEKPSCLDEMLNVVKELSSEFSFSRIDLYVMGDKLFFGEITFHPESAYGLIFENKEHDLILGELF